VVVANLRTEFVSADLRKLYANEIVVPGLAPEELVRVAGARMGSANEARQRALKDGGFYRLAERLSSWTTNAWGYLCWLADLDYETIDFSPDDDAALRKALLGLADKHYAGLRREEI